MDTGEVKARKEPAREEDSQRRWPLGVVVALVLLGGVLVGLISLMSLNWLLRSEPFWSRPTPPTQRGLPQPLEIVKVALTIVAGVGGLVALTVAYRRQVWLEADTAGQRERRKALHDRYGTAVAQLGHENPNVRLAGVYALANLADEWDAQRQQCIDVLCAYLRVPWDPEPDERHPLARKSIESPGPRRTTTTYTYTHSLGEGEVRRTIIRVIAAHLRAPHGSFGTHLPGPWSGLALDFTGAVLPEANFHGCTLGDARFTRAHLQSSAMFEGARFSGGVWFEEARFPSDAWFADATFSKDAWFADATFSYADFGRATFSGNAMFAGATFGRGVMCGGAKFRGSAVFAAATFSESAVFGRATFSSCADFRSVTFCGDAVFAGATFSGDALFVAASFTPGSGPPEVVQVRRLKGVQPPEAAVQ